MNNVLILGRPSPILQRRNQKIYLGEAEAHGHPSLSPGLVMPVMPLSHLQSIY